MISANSKNSLNRDEEPLNEGGDDGEEQDKEPSNKKEPSSKKEPSNTPDGLEHPEP
jgi:hypothetical protein